VARGGVQPDTAGEMVDPMPSISCSRIVRLGCSIRRSA
jgi:hypothetical protein